MDRDDGAERRPLPGYFDQPCNVGDEVTLASEKADFGCTRDDRRWNTALSIQRRRNRRHLGCRKRAGTPLNILLMGSDTHPNMGYAGIEGVSLALQCDSVAEVDQLFAALKDGGEVTMPPDRTFWSERFCMFKDRFGVDWMVNFEGGAKAA